MPRDMFCVYVYVAIMVFILQTQQHPTRRLTQSTLTDVVTTHLKESEKKICTPAIHSYYSSYIADLVHRVINI